MIPIILALTTALAAPEACEAGLQADAIEATLARAEVHLAALDMAAFVAEVDQAAAQVGCLEVPVTSHLAARLHRNEGFRHFGPDTDLARGAFAAAQSLDPDWSPPVALVPAGRNPLRAAWDTAGLQTTDRVDLPPPPTGQVLLDGRPGLGVPTAWPTVLQWVDDDGRVRRAAWLSPGETPAPWPVPANDTVVRSTTHRVPLAVAAGGAAVACGALYGLAAHGQARFKDVSHSPVPDARLAGVQARTNALGVGSYVAAAASLGLGATLIVTW